MSWAGCDLCWGCGMQECTTCGGDGVRAGDPILDDYWWPCLDCGGIGSVRCSSCEAALVIARRELLDVLKKGPPGNTA
jgi:DnaJ-class molecular chaperone